MAIQKGPVACNYGSVYNEVVKNGFAEVKEIDFDDFVGEQFRRTKTIEKDDFEPTEITVLKKVSERFKGCSTKQIVNMSHSEKAWQQNADHAGRISYDYSFELKHLEE